MLGQHTYGELLAPRGRASAQKATDAAEIRNLPKWGWILLIIFFDTIGSIAYWIAGRPRRAGISRGGQRRILPPDDDPDFLRKL